MSPIVTTLATSTLTFAATNIDDIFVLTLFFSQTSRGFRSPHIVAGQYLGFSALVAISLVGFFGGRILPQTWVGVLGLVPILVGVRRWIHRHDPPVHVKASATASTTAVAAVTFANGGDNIGVYTPLFASSDATRLSITLLTFYFAPRYLVLCWLRHYPPSRRRSRPRWLRTHRCSVCPCCLGDLHHRREWRV